MTLIQIDKRTWINTQSVDYIYYDSDGDVIIGCGNEKFTIYGGDPERVLEKINQAIMIESAFSKIKA